MIYPPKKVGWDPWRILDSQGDNLVWHRWLCLSRGPQDFMVYPCLWPCLSWSKKSDFFFPHSPTFCSKLLRANCWPLALIGMVSKKRIWETKDFKTRCVHCFSVEMLLMTCQNVHQLSPWFPMDCSPVQRCPAIEFLLAFAQIGSKKVPLRGGLKNCTINIYGPKRPTKSSHNSWSSAVFSGHRPIIWVCLKIG